MSQSSDGCLSWTIAIAILQLEKVNSGNDNMYPGLQRSGMDADFSLVASQTRGSVGIPQPSLVAWMGVRKTTHSTFVFYFGFVNRHLAWFTDIKPHKAHLSCIDISANRIWESQIESLYDFFPQISIRFSTCPHLSFRWSLTKNSSKRRRRGVGGRWWSTKETIWFSISGVPKNPKWMVYNGKIYL